MQRVAVLSRYKVLNFRRWIGLHEIRTSTVISMKLKKFILVCMTSPVSSFLTEKIFTPWAGSCDVKWFWTKPALDKVEDILDCSFWSVEMTIAKTILYIIILAQRQKMKGWRPVWFCLVFFNIISIKLLDEPVSFHYLLKSYRDPLLDSILSNSIMLTTKQVMT